MKNETTSTVKLTQGTKYDVVAVTSRYSRWSTESGDAEGRTVADYFDGDGCYLGPDVDGVEPLFAPADEDRECERYANCTPETDEHDTRCRASATQAGR